MSLVTAQRVSLSFPGKQIFHEMGFQVEPGDRIGLVGPNGSGKSTFLKLIMGETAADSGEIRVTKGTRTGYLSQDVQETLSGPLLQSVIGSIPGRAALKDDLRRAEQNLKAAQRRQEQGKYAEMLAEIHQEIDRLELQFPGHEAQKILAGLGFETKDFDRPVSSLSGGWKMRAALASILYQRPDLLLMDEPTNHLDIPSIQWLEAFLQDFDGAMILVSHDRDFLNRQIHRIISLGSEGMRSYSGNYDFYLKASEEEKKSLEAEARNREQKIKEAQKFIDRFRAKASKARQAQSKIKLMEKMELVEGFRREKTVHFSFPDVPRSGRVVMSFRGISKGFNELPLYKDVDLTVLRGERIAIIGPNGCGKTTLLRIVAGEIEPDEGKIVLGHGAIMGYFAQHHSEMLDLGKSVIEEVYQVVPDETIGFVRGVCGAFLFTGKDVDKVIGVLSGGERARVSLAKLLVRPGNLMVMDEPTNHLDILSSEKLIEALQGYTGTLLFVSHNHSFINRLATKIWDIKDREIIEYPGNLEEYLHHLAGSEMHRAGESYVVAEDESGLEALPAEDRIQKTPAKAGRNRKEQKRERAEKRKLIYDTIKPIQSELERLEEKIAELEVREKELEISLADPEVFRNKNQSQPLLNAYKCVREELDELLLKWEQTQGELESAKDKLGV
jgi:ATP-binding cassette subfamily F protein 3